MHKSKTLVIVPIHKDNVLSPLFMRPINDKSALMRTIDFCEHIKKVENNELSICITTDDQGILEEIKVNKNIYAPKRTKVNRKEAILEAFKQSEKFYSVKFDYLIILEPPHPFRPPSLAEEAFSMLRADENIDSVVCVQPIRGRIWSGDGNHEPIADSFGRDTVTTHPYGEIPGLFHLIKSSLLDEDKLDGEKVGLLVVDSKWAILDVKSETDFNIAEKLEDILFNQ